MIRVKETFNKQCIVRIIVKLIIVKNLIVKITVIQGYTLGIFELVLTFFISIRYKLGESPRYFTGKILQ
jgi:hypothetical protein